MAPSLRKSRSSTINSPEESRTKHKQTVFSLTSNEESRPDGKPRCSALFKNLPNRCTNACVETSEYCKHHVGWASKAGSIVGYEKYNPTLDASSSDDDEDERDGKEDSDDASDDASDGGGSDDEGAPFEPEGPPPDTMFSRTRTGEQLKLGAIDELIDYEPDSNDDGSARPGLVASEDEMQASTLSSWEDVSSPSLQNIRKFFPSDVLKAYPPNDTRYRDLVDAIVGQEVQLQAFGGDQSTSLNVALLLGKISHTKKLSHLSQLDEILEILRYVKHELDDLSGEAAQKLWVIGDESEVTHTMILKAFGTNVATALASGILFKCNDAREAGTSIFDLSLSFPRCLMFLAPSGHASLDYLRTLFELAPYGTVTLDSESQALLNAGEWSATEFYANMLESHLTQLDETVKGISMTEEGWALQPSIKQFKSASIHNLAFYVRGVTKALEAQKRSSTPKRKRNAQFAGGSEGTSKSRLLSKAHLPSFPATAVMRSRDRSPAPAPPLSLCLPGPTPEATGAPPAASAHSSDGTEAVALTSEQRSQIQRKNSLAYANPKGVSGLLPAVQHVIAQGKGDDTRYKKRLNGPAAGAKKHYRTQVSKLARTLGISLSDGAIDYMLQRQFSRINFNLYERNSATLGLEAKQKKQKQQLPVHGLTTLLKQLHWFEKIYSCIVGPHEAATIVSFWIREFEEMRYESNVDWNTAYTIWRNTLVDYEIRWSEWDPDQHAAPLMWDWEDRTQKIYDKVLGRANLDVFEAHINEWDTTPVIYAEVSISDASTVDPSDASAFTSMTSILTTLSTRASRTTGTQKTQRTQKKTKRQKQLAKRTPPKAKKVLFQESDSSEESSDDSSDEEPDRAASLEKFGRPCRNKAGKTVAKCGDCSFFATNKVCAFYHEDAPPGTTGKRSTLTEAAEAKLLKLGAWKRRGRQR